MKYLTRKDLVYAIAAEAKHLADQSMVCLRIEAPQYANSAGGALRETRGRTRGELIEELLTEKFEDEMEEVEA